MISLFQAKKIQVAQSQIHGWGVFATHDIAEGELIEECPFVELPIEPGENSSLLIDYRFNYPSGLATPETKQVIVLGCGMIYNHSNSNNAKWVTDSDRKSFKFYAEKMIKRGEEICTYYGGDEYWKDGRTKTEVK